MDGWTDSNMSYYIYSPEKKMTMYFTLIEKETLNLEEAHLCQFRISRKYKGLD